MMPPSTSFPVFDMTFRVGVIGVETPPQSSRKARDAEVLSIVKKAKAFVKLG